ncbi:MAG: aminotransferase class I/II-fold pyridoxal phosphate-dependent enzyme [Firmicutes bacterium]|nr:aminotransferase class I/II-fold pyridoxal phosphate-dependent enzyme [Bacillota bacterium]
MNTPLHDRLIAYSKEKRISFAMPGHKGRTDFSDLARCDVTELEKTADLHSESEAVAAANELLSSFYKTKRSFILTSGSTTAVQSMITAAVRPGETLLISSDCHMSVINICAVLGVNIRVINQDIDKEFLIPRAVKSVRVYLESCPDIKGVLLTSPSYYGICADIKTIADECREFKVPLLVDEAHGAHFAATERLPESAASYADMVCQSAHKTLNALTGAAYLHVGGDLIDPNTVRKAINIYESSSPSYVIAASADFARAKLEGENGWDECVSMCAKFKSRIERLGISALENDDETRLVLNVARRGITGFNAENILSERYGIDVEMSDLRSIVLIVTPKNTNSDFDALYKALSEIIKTDGDFSDGTKIYLPRRRGIINPRAAFFADCETVSLSDSVNRISKSAVCAYPPGTPIILTGEVVTEERAELIARLANAGARIIGLKNDGIEVVVEKNGR